MKDKGMQKYLDALEAGDAALLEELAIKAGYTERYEGPPNINEYKRKLEVRCALMRSKTAQNAVADHQSFRQAVRRISMRYFGKKWTDDCLCYDQWYLSSFEKADDSGKQEEMMQFLERVEYTLKRIAEISELSANGQSGFIRIRKGPVPFKHSFASFSVCGLWGRYERDRLSHKQLFIDVFDEDLFIEQKLDFGAAVAKLNQDAYDKKSRLSPGDVCYIARMMADTFSLDHGTENLIYGKKAVEYLCSLTQGRRSDLFPLSAKRYERLIAKQEQKVRDLEMRNCLSPNDLICLKRVLIKLSENNALETLRLTDNADLDDDEVTALKKLNGLNLAPCMVEVASRRLMNLVIRCRTVYP